MMKAALIGLGNIAWRYDSPRPSGPPRTHAGAFLAHPDVELLGGCSPSPTDREDFSNWSGGLPAFESTDAMLETLRPEIVGVCSPTHLHFEHALRSMRAGAKMVWLEKMPATTLAQVDQLIDLADRSGTTVCVNYIRRYAVNYSHVRHLYQSGQFGQCHVITILYSPGFVRNGAHFVDLLLHLTGADDVALHAMRPNGDSPQLMLELAGGIPVQMTGADVAYHTNSLSMVCDGGILTIPNGGESVCIQRKIEDPQFPGFFAVADRTAEAGVDVSMGDYMRAALDDLIESSGARKEPRSSLRTARPTQRLLDEVRL